ncbi:MAG: PQQ-binding-like beta-propeller repeat protein [Deltaproteobacteria bacterium]|nr:PQQ-binding-like beta-propeller repeat protein [Deltaproteobacteria bacterium]
MPKLCLESRLAKAALVLSVASVIAGCAATPPPTRQYSAWSTQFQGETRSNVSPDAIALPLEKAWTKDISAFRFINRYEPQESSSPVISDGVLYTGSDAGDVYAIELATGSVRWSFDADYPVEGTVSTGDGRVCFGSANGVFRCLDAATGIEAWRFQTKSGIVSSPLIRDGRVWFTSSDDRLYALSLNNGEKLWVYNRGTYQTVAPRVPGSSAFYDGKLYQLFSDGYVVALSAETGKELWAVKTAPDFDTALATRRVPLVHDGKVYVIDGKNAVVALDGATGKTMAAYDAIAAYDFVIVGDRTLVAAGSDYVVAVDMRSGAILWKKELTHKPISSIIAAGDHLFILSNFKKALWDISYFEKSMGHIEAVRLSSGEALWSEELKSTLTARAGAAYGYAAVVADKGSVRVYAPSAP